jgi:hypothetical protein
MYKELIWYIIISKYNLRILNLFMTLKLKSLNTLIMLKTYKTLQKNILIIINMKVLYYQIIKYSNSKIRNLIIDKLFINGRYHKNRQ